MTKCFSMFITVIITTTSFAFNKPQYEATTVLAFKRVNQVVPSGDGKQVVFTIYEVKPTAAGKKWEYSLYLKNTQGKMTLLDKAGSINAVNWSPDNNQIAYLGKGDKYQSIWINDISNQTKHKLIEFNNDITSFKWSPDGQNIAFTAAVSKKNSSQILSPIDINKDDANTRLYLVNTKLKSSAETITPDSYSISQFFVYPGFDWAPDSQSIVFAYQPKPGPAYSLQNKIGIINLKTKQIKNIPYTETHNSTQPSYSLDGKWIAFQSNPTMDEVAEQIHYVKSEKPSPLLLMSSKINHICIFNTKSSKTYCLADTYNQNPIMIGWNSANNAVLVFDPYYKTEGPRIYLLSLDSSNSPRVINNINGFIEPLTISLNNRHDILGFGYETIANAPEAFISHIEPFQLEQISHLTLNQKSLGNMQTINWQSSDGFTIEGLLITPKNYDPNKKYPLLVNLHGGPASAWSKRYLGGCDEYEEMIDPTTCWGNLLGMGFIILQPNPRGSDGYGAAFRLANFADFGGGDYRDVMSGVDYLIQQHIADADHLAIAGWSYGGYLTGWTISQTNHFKAAVDGDGNTDWISYAVTSNQPLFTKSYFGTEFWNNRDLYLQRSTVFYVKKITTPLLILHGENDIGQVPITQAKELYNSLQQQNKNVDMFILPKQGHVPTDANVIYESIIKIDEWLKQAL